MRSLFAVLAAAAIVALRVPVIGLDLAFGGVCGIINMLLVMRANERLLEGRASMGGHIGAAFLRLLLFGAAPVFVAARGPWWGMGVYFAGFFMPLTLYILTLQRRYRRKAS